MIGQGIQLTLEVQKRDRGKRAWLRQAPSARRLNTGIQLFQQEAGDVIKQGRHLM